MSAQTGRPLTGWTDWTVLTVGSLQSESTRPCPSRPPMTDEGWAGWPPLVVERKANPEQVELDGERVDPSQKRAEVAAREGDPPAVVAVGP